MVTWSHLLLQADVRRLCRGDTDGAPPCSNVFRTPCTHQTDMKRHIRQTIDRNGSIVLLTCGLGSSGSASDPVMGDDRAPCHGRVAHSSNRLLVQVQRLPGYFKQRDNLMYPAWAYVFPTTILRLPCKLALSRLLHQVPVLFYTHGC